MKTILSLFTLLGIFALTGCSADDLAGPDAASDAPLAGAARADKASAAEVFSVAGTWQASDESGSITLFIDELGPPPQGSLSAAGSIEGKGVITDLARDPIAVTVEGKYEVRDIAFTIDHARRTIAKAEGEISRDFSFIKVILYEGNDRDRTLIFERF
jgi:hypothetical protein